MFVTPLNKQTMHKLFFILSVSLVLTKAFCQNEQETLQNKDIIAMRAANVEESIVQSKISNSKCDFVLSPTEVIALKEAKVSDRILVSMLHASPQKGILNNKDIILMSKPLSSSLIKTLMKETPHKFDTSTTGIIELSNNNVSESIIKEIIANPIVLEIKQNEEASKAVVTTPPSATKETSNAKVKEESGAWDKIIITNVYDEVKNLKRIGDINASKQRVFGSQSVLKQEALVELRKTAYAKGATHIYIQNENFAFTPINNYNISAVAYKK